MLDDVALEQYSRQIILPEVGGRGQERLLAARVGVVGDGDAARSALDLLTRAGVHAAGGTHGDVLIDLRSGPETRDAARPTVLGAISGASACVTTVVGRPCARCVDAETPHATDATFAALAPAVAGALGALAALEALRVLLLRPARGRRTVLDLGTGAFRASELPSGRGCAACGGTS
jgi:molybdopterin/thiamine biosynthesis adenylyltransferase